MSSRYPRIASYRDIRSFRGYLAGFAPELPADDEILRAGSSPLARPLEIGTLRAGNRWAIQPMEGWDGDAAGRPSELTERRWRHFGESGAKLIWGGEAVAVRADGRANPNQLVIADETLAGLSSLRSALLDAHARRFGAVADLVVGLQLTHSGRYSRPRADRPSAPRVAYRHPILDSRTRVTGDECVLSDAEVDELIGDFVAAAVRARSLGFDFVDIKNCHGYLLHEFLGAHSRAGRYGGSFANRTRILREIVRGIRRDAPDLEIAVRLSAFDLVPFRPATPDDPGVAAGVGVPAAGAALTPYLWGFGVERGDPTRGDLAEARELLRLLGELGIRLVNITAGSPYYNPHVQRPALYPPSDGYLPPEDPTAGVVRQLRAARDLKRDFPDLVVVGSALSYLQDYLPHVAQALVRDGWMDAVGLGRMVLSYWDLPADVLEKGELDHRRICRTFSDCTTAARHGLPSGCYPLDPRYKSSAEASALREAKRGR